MQISKISLKTKPELAFIRDFLRSYTKRAFLVGGSVRDLFLGLEVNDFDIELYDLSIEDFEKLMQKLGAKGFGKSFFVYKFENFDLSLARIENKISYGHKGFEVSLCQDEKIAAKRRDFSINALMINIFNDELLDFYNGLNDLQNGILRHIDDDSFKEDSLRILRAIYFVSRFNFDINDLSLKLMQSMDISDLSLDRINSELYKFFKGQYLSKAFFYLQKLNLEKRLFNLDTNDENFIILLEKYRKFIKDDSFFLYFYLNYFNINKKDFFKRTRLKNSYLKASYEPFFKDDMSDFDFMKISTLMPLKTWLGLWDEERIKRARELKIYNESFKSEISSQSLMQQGFYGKMLGEKLASLKELELKNYLKKFKD
ncbi:MULTISPECIES: CCA tRNA nucleotidyltransferase [unclassified Campylobacter]|uniref:CCA tRNA nucleotidyltransferase n=1 Tax=unclassified Campylobacter TaxID=2593542 RepID=UPI00123813E7|nr:MULTISPECIES: CCA tRNA nucleotidyltransferase [unclassified Campylobacter]KAA6227204.1 CCA tRNA nucleotidyltransferase [Campylobacter sp. LR286c]KAA6228331.1 CCA tRNA nucleotidyltransferase [Campylobacter sp. LR196d]KAA6231138.1 CCA tRNA nucleotidyltransferase [Campylobacter sp. LR264d]